MTRLSGLRKLPVRILVFSLLPAVLLLVSCDFAGAGSSQSRARTLTGRIQGASYVIEVPASWNGTLLLYSHGGGELVANAY